MRDFEKNGGVDMFREILSFWGPIFLLVGGGLGFIWKVANGKQSKSNCANIHTNLNQQLTDIKADVRLLVDHLIEKKQ